MPPPPQIRTPYDIRLTTTALASLLVSGHPAIDAIQVRRACRGGPACLCILCACLASPLSTERLPAHVPRALPPHARTLRPDPAPHAIHHPPRTHCPHLLRQVKGKRLDTEGGVRTRARARATAEQWSAVPLRVKIVMLLTDAYIEATTQGAPLRRLLGLAEWRGWVRRVSAESVQPANT